MCLPWNEERNCPWIQRNRGWFGKVERWKKLANGCELRWELDGQSPGQPLVMMTSRTSVHGVEGWCSSSTQSEWPPATEVVGRRDHFPPILFCFLLWLRTVSTTVRADKETATRMVLGTQTPRFFISACEARLANRWSIPFASLLSMYQKNS